MGVIFNDPDLELHDMCWYIALANQMENSLARNEGLITVDPKLNTISCYVELHSHPVGIDGQNHIIAVTPLKFLPPEEFQKRQKSIDSDRKLAIMSSIPKIATEVIEKKIKAMDLKEKGDVAFMIKKFAEAEKCYSEAIELNIGYRPFWTNREKCRNVMKKYQEAISDCDSALLIDPKCTKSII